MGQIFWDMKKLKRSSSVTDIVYYTCIELAEILNNSAQRLKCLSILKEPHHYIER